MNRIIVFLIIAAFLSAFRAPLSFAQDSVYAKEVLKIEAKERAADVKYWRQRLSLRHHRSKGRLANEYPVIERAKIQELSRLRDDFKKIVVPANCRNIHRQFIASKEIRIDTLEKSMNYSARLPLGGMSDSEYREVFGEWFNYKLSLESESYQSYKVAWLELVRKLPPGFKMPPFSALDYQFKVYEANIKGWLSGQSCSTEEEMYRIWHGFMVAVQPPENCRKIHAMFLMADSLTIKSAAPGISADEREALANRASRTSDKAWFKLSELIAASY